MFRPRNIPVLLLKGDGLVKTIKFSKPTYIGDPINAVKIFNDLKADELVFLDINASVKGEVISLEFVKKVADEAFMPFAVGGGIHTMEQVKNLISSGAEKVVLNTSINKNPTLIKEAVERFGSQSIIGSIDVRKGLFGSYKVRIKGGKQGVKSDLESYVKYVESLGVGEIMINSIDRDGVMNGYDHELVSIVANLVEVPVIACGGAGNLSHMVDVVKDAGAHAAAAGSVFVFHSKTKGVLVNYPTSEELKQLFE